eukprot:scaffold6769_cov114-Isochrysis_galbana.AAC.3
MRSRRSGCMHACGKRGSVTRSIAAWLRSNGMAEAPRRGTTTRTTESVRCSKTPGTGSSPPSACRPTPAERGCPNGRTGAEPAHRLTASPTEKAWYGRDGADGAASAALRCERGPAAGGRRDSRRTGEPRRSPPAAPPAPPPTPRATAAASPASAAASCAAGTARSDQVAALQPLAFGLRVAQLLVLPARRAVPKDGPRQLLRWWLGYSTPTFAAGEHLARPAAQHPRVTGRGTGLKCSPTRRQHQPTAHQGLE